MTKKSWLGCLHSWKWTWNLNHQIEKGKSFLQTLIFGFQPLIFQGVNIIRCKQISHSRTMAMIGGKDKSLNQVAHFQVPCKVAVRLLVRLQKYRLHINLELQGQPVFLWLFQLDDSKSLHKKWLEITKHPLKNGCLGYQELDCLLMHTVTIWQKNWYTYSPTSIFFGHSAVNLIFFS